MVKKIIIYTLLIVVSVLSFNNSVNKHYHISANGVVVEHSHPYSKTQSHSHSTEEMASFSLFASHFESFVSAVVLPLCTSVNWDVLFQDTLDLEIVFVKIFSNKSPPLNIFF